MIPGNSGLFAQFVLVCDEFAFVHLSGEHMVCFDSAMCFLFLATIQPTTHTPRAQYSKQKWLKCQFGLDTRNRTFSKETRSLFRFIKIAVHDAGGQTLLNWLKPLYCIHATSMVGKTEFIYLKQIQKRNMNASNSIGR